MAVIVTLTKMNNGRFKFINRALSNMRKLFLLSQHDTFNRALSNMRKLFLLSQHDTCNVNDHRLCKFGELLPSTELCNT